MRLEAKNLSFSYDVKGRQILRQFSLSADSSERVGIIAPSGFGKTTLCKILSGYEAPQSGEVLLDGKPLSEYGAYCPVQMIWQHPEQAVNPRLRMKNVIEEGDRTAPELIEKLGIEPDWMNRFPTELSGGELQEPWDREPVSFWQTRSQPCWISSPRARSGIFSSKKQNEEISECS